MVCMRDCAQDKLTLSIRSRRVSLQTRFLYDCQFYITDWENQEIGEYGFLLLLSGPICHTVRGKAYLPRVCFQSSILLAQCFRFRPMNTGFIR